MTGVWKVRKPLEQRLVPSVTFYKYILLRKHDYLENKALTSQVVQSGWYTLLRDETQRQPEWAELTLNLPHSGSLWAAVLKEEPWNLEVAPQDSAAPCYHHPVWASGQSLARGQSELPCSPVWGFSEAILINCLTNGNFQSVPEYAPSECKSKLAVHLSILVCPSYTKMTIILIVSSIKRPKSNPIDMPG